MDPTFELKSGGSVLVPVRRLTRKAFQFEYLCCKPAGKQIKKTTQKWSAALNSGHPTIGALILEERLTFGRYEGFAAGSAPSHRVHLWDAEVAPEVFAVVAVEAFIPQQSLEAWTAQNTQSATSEATVS